MAGQLLADCARRKNNDAMDAETAYLFRHGLICDAAYELQTLGNRARLHAITLEILEQIFHEPERRKSNALELARHAALAQMQESDRVAEFAEKEFTYLKMVLAHARNMGDETDSEAVIQRMLNNAHVDESEVLATRSFLAGLLIRHGRFREGVDLGKEVVTAAQERGDARISMNTQATLALGLDYLGETDEAEKCTHDAINTARAIEDKASLATFLSDVSSIYRLTGRMSEAEAALEESLELGIALGSASHCARTKGQFAIVRWVGGKLESAERFCREALSSFSELGMERSYSVHINNLGLILKHQGRYAEAMAALHECLEVHRRLGNARSHALVSGNIGSLCEETGDLDAAMEWFTKAEEECRAIGLARNAHLAVLGRAWIFVSRGEFETARRDALEVQRAGASSVIPEAMALLGAVDILTGSDAAGRELWRQGIKKLEEAGNEAARKGVIGNATRAVSRLGFQGVSVEDW